MSLFKPHNERSTISTHSSNHHGKDLYTEPSIISVEWIDRVTKECFYSSHGIECFGLKSVLYVAYSVVYLNCWVATENEGECKI